MKQTYTTYTYTYNLQNKYKWNNVDKIMQQGVDNTTIWR